MITELDQMTDGQQQAYLSASIRLRRIEQGIDPDTGEWRREWNQTADCSPPATNHPNPRKDERMSEAKLGQLIDETAERDAVHVAIAPVKAGEVLYPGMHVGLKDGMAVVNKTHIGIVDPYLSGPIAEGRWFYLCLYPNTVTGMRHHWHHASFSNQPPIDLSDKMKYSEQWLRFYAANLNCYDEPEAAFQRLIQDLRAGEINSHGSDLYGLDGLERSDELREHAERYLGIRIDWSRFNFSCSC